MGEWRIEQATGINDINWHNQIDIEYQEHYNFKANLFAIPTYKFLKPSLNLASREVVN